MKEKIGLIFDKLYLPLMISLLLFIIFYMWYFPTLFGEGFKWHQDCHYEYIAMDSSRNKSNHCSYNSKGIPKCNGKEVYAFTTMCKAK